MKQSEHLNPSEETRTGCPVTSKYGRTPPNKHGGVGRQQHVLNNRSPPINDEETFLSKQKRATLAQLRSGHCKLLYSYKKRFKETVSSSCPYCGMDSRDVPHLFNCTAHLNNMSPVYLWNKPVMTIWELSFLDPGNLD